MRLRLNAIEVVRTDLYSSRLSELLAVSKRRFKRASRMESTLTAAAGFPESSKYAIKELNLIEQAEWQRLIPFMDCLTPGGASTSLRYVEVQRVMAEEDISIFYAVLNLSTRQRIVLLDLHYLPEISWGEVIRHIYNDIMTRK